MDIKKREERKEKREERKELDMKKRKEETTDNMTIIFLQACSAHVYKREADIRR